MVGVPGRSKGCRTCRRRKKGCDLRRPTCGQCELRGIQCEGYDLDRIFIHTSAPSSSGVFAIELDRKRFITPWHIDQIDYWRWSPSNIDIVLPHSLLNSAYREKTLEMFFSAYMPHSDHHDRDSMVYQRFAYVLSSLYARDEALKLAVLALSTAMLGKMQREEEWLRQGRRLYGKALQEMRKAFGDNQRAKSEAIFVVPRIAIMFEMLFGADANPTMQAQSWRSHAQGELAVIKGRGPHAMRDEIAHQIFVDSRYAPIIVAIRMRKATILNNVDWKTIPWEKHARTPKDELLDVLAGIPEILEDIDNLHGESIETPEHGEGIWARIAIKCRTLEADLKSWATSHKLLTYNPGTESAIKITFPDMSTAYLTLFYWTASLWVYGTLSVVSQRKSPLDSPSFSLSSADPVTYARRITRAVPYFFQPSSGIWGAISVSFPMGIATLCLRKDGEEKNKEYLSLVHRALGDPNLPSAIQDFLNSMRQAAVHGSNQGQPKFDGEFWKQ